MNYTEAQLQEMMSAWNYISLMLEGPEAKLFEKPKDFTKMLNNIKKGKK